MFFEWKHMELILMSSLSSRLWIVTESSTSRSFRLIIEPFSYDQVSLKSIGLVSVYELLRLAKVIPIRNMAKAKIF